MKTIIKSISALTLVVALLLSLCSCGATTSIKLKDVVEVTIDGYNGHAKVHLSVDDNAINAKINSKKAAKYYSKINGYDAYDKEDSFFYQLDTYAASEDYFGQFLDIAPAEDYDTLSNGDEVVIVVKPKSYLEQDGITLKDIKKGLGLSIDSEMKYKVSGLETAKEVKIFNNIDKYVTFTGANGYGTAEIRFTEDYVFTSEGYYFSYYSANTLLVVKDNRSLGYIGFSITTDESTKNGELKKGDVIKVTISDNNNVISLMENDGCIPSAESYNVTVPDLGTYITNGSELTDAEFNQIKNELIAKISERYTEATIEGFLYDVVKPEKVVQPEKKFMVTVVFSHVGWFSTNTSGIDVSGIIRSADGKLTYNIGDIYSLYNGMDSLSDNWNYTRVV